MVYRAARPPNLAPHVPTKERKIHYIYKILPLPLSYIEVIDFIHTTQQTTTIYPLSIASKPPSFRFGFGFLSSILTYPFSIPIICSFFSDSVFHFLLIFLGLIAAIFGPIQSRWVKSA